MSTTYPAVKMSFTNPAGSDTQDSPDHASQHDDVNDTVEAIQDTIGTTSGTSVLKYFSAGNFPVRMNVAGQLQQNIAGTINNSVLGTPSITGGTINNPVLGTPSSTGGTIANALHSGTLSSSVGTLNNIVMGSPSITGGTHSYGTLSYGLVSRATTSGLVGYASAYNGTAGGTVTLDLAGANEHRVAMPNAAGSVTLAIANALDNEKFIVSCTQGTAGLGTIGWFATIKWQDGVTPTLTTTANKRDTFGFICTSGSTYDGFVVGQNI